MTTTTLLILAAAGIGALAQDRVPFTVTRRESAYDKAGKVSRTETVVFAVRGDGSTVLAHSSASPGRMRSILDVARAEEVSIDGLTKAITTIPLPGAAAEFHRRRNNCTSGNPVVRARVLGHEVVHHINDIVGTPGRMLREEEWRAPALDCFALKTVLWAGPTIDVLRIVKVNEAVEIVPGEPSAALFERPAGYVERSPRQ